MGALSIAKNYSKNDYFVSVCFLSKILQILLLFSN